MKIKQSNPTYQKCKLRIGHIVICLFDYWIRNIKYLRKENILQQYIFKNHTRQV